MAAQVRRAGGIQNEQAYVDFYYDDTNMIVTRVGWANLLSVPVRCFVIKQDGTTILDTTIAANTAEQQRNLPGNQRFNVETESPSVNLSS